MIATGSSDYWCWTVVGELLVAGLERRILGIPPRVVLVVWEKLDTRSSARRSKGWLGGCGWFSRVDLLVVRGSRRCGRLQL
jgi:hypothetical protein